MNFYRSVFVLNLLISLHGIMGHDSIVQHKKFQSIWTSRGGVSFNQEGEKVNSFKEKEFLEQQKLRQGHDLIMAMGEKGVGITWSRNKKNWTQVSKAKRGSNSGKSNPNPENQEKFKCK